MKKTKSKIEIVGIVAVALLLLLISIPVSSAIVIRIDHPETGSYIQGEMSDDVYKPVRTRLVIHQEPQPIIIDGKIIGWHAGFHDDFQGGFDDNGNSLPCTSVTLYP